MRSWPIVLVMLVFAMWGSSGADVWYVDVDNAAGPWDGASWVTAFNSIQAGVDAAAAAGGGEVWVAEGTYTGAGDNVVDMANSVHLYGGFVGTESVRDARDWQAHRTIIDGERTLTRRCIHASGVNDAILDGFTVTNGYTSGDGGGMYNSNSSPRVTNCTFSRDRATRGGGMFNLNSSPTVARCTFSGNFADGSGAGMYNSNSSPTVTDCTFLRSGAVSGGGMYNDNSSPTVTNCTFSDNSAWAGGGGFSSYGGGMYNRGGALTVTNCTFWNNRAWAFDLGVEDCSVIGCGGGMANLDSTAMVVNCTFLDNSARGCSDTDARGGGMYISGPSPTVINCILKSGSGGEIYGSASATYSYVQGLSDPQFVVIGILHIV